MKTIMKTIMATEAIKATEAIETIKAVKTIKTSEKTEAYPKLSILVCIVLIWIPRSSLVCLEIANIQHL
jgi:hypothetical protein